MQALAKLLGALAAAAGIVGGVALMGLMFTTVLDVTLRSAWGIAFLGVSEITELGLVVVAILGIAYCGWTEGHIALEIGERLVPPTLWRGIQVIIRLLSSAIAGVVAFYSFSEAVSVYDRAARSNLLQVPEFPFYTLVGLGFLTYAIILLVRAVQGHEIRERVGTVE